MEIGREEIGRWSWAREHGNTGNTRYTGNGRKKRSHFGGRILGVIGTEVVMGGCQRGLKKRSQGDEESFPGLWLEANICDRRSEGRVPGRC